MQSIGVWKKLWPQAAYGQLLPPGEKEAGTASCFLQIAPQLM
jgi:hypothetical protein